MFVLGASSAAATATTSTHLLCGTLHSPYSLTTTHNLSSHLFPTTSVRSSSLQFRCVPIRAMAEIDTIAVSKTASSSSPGSKQALISLSNKKDLAFVGNGLQELGCTIVSTGGTASALESAGVAVTKVEQLTKFPEMLDGRVKTLHPNIHGGILARRDQKHHIEALSTHGIGTFDVVVVNLYPFYDTVTSA